MGYEALYDVPQGGRPASAVTEESVEAARNLIDEDPRVTKKILATHLSIESAAVLSILREHL